MPGRILPSDDCGEPFLELGDLGRAECNPNRLGRLCGSCKNYDDLTQAIGAFKAKPKT